MKFFTKFGSRRMYTIGYGPFCTTCGCQLHVHACCHCTGHGVPFEEINEILDNIHSSIKKSNLQFNYRLKILLGKTKQYRLSPIETLALSSAWLRYYPSVVDKYWNDHPSDLCRLDTFIAMHILAINRCGILAFSAETKGWILFQAPYVTVVSPKQALMMLLVDVCIGFCVRPDGFIQIHVTDT